MRHHRTVIFLALLWATPALACNVPVFRYALERWPADPYVISILHRGPLSPQYLPIIEALKKTGETTANLQTELTDLNEIFPRLGPDWLPDAIHSFEPTMVVGYPERDQIPKSPWCGPLSAPHVKQLIDSPTRRELATRLLKGQSAVWILLESGDAKADAAAIKLLDETLAKLEKELKLPEPDPDDPRMNANVPLTIKFTSMRLSRSDPAEAVLVSMLQNIHRKIASEAGPIVFPIFGRGRILTGLFGKQLDEETIADAAGFITGACSCEAKSQNPGIDLLLAADWEALIEGRAVKDVELPPLIGLSQFAAPATKPSVVPVISSVLPPAQGIPPASPTQSSTTGSLARNLLIVAGIAVALLLLGSLAMRRKSV